VGSIEEGKIADLVLWKPAFFGVKPSLIVKGGMIAAAAHGRSQRLDPHAAAGALPPDVRRLRRRAAHLGHLRVAGGARESRGAGPGAAPPLEAVRDTRGIGKKHMVHNAWMPKLEVDPETYEVRADGELLTCEPARELPMAQRYFLF
jgi:urease subunit alpha